MAKFRHISYLEYKQIKRDKQKRHYCKSPFARFKKIVKQLTNKKVKKINKDRIRHEKYDDLIDKASVIDPID